jgi:hypothetical protein
LELTETVKRDGSSFIALVAIKDMLFQSMVRIVTGLDPGSLAGHWNLRRWSRQSITLALAISISEMVTSIIVEIALTNFPGKLFPFLLYLKTGENCID